MRTSIPLTSVKSLCGSHSNFHCSIPTRKPSSFYDFPKHMQVAATNFLLLDGYGNISYFLGALAVISKFESLLLLWTSSRCASEGQSGSGACCHCFQFRLRWLMNQLLTCFTDRPVCRARDRFSPSCNRRPSNVVTFRWILRAAAQTPA